MTGDDLRAALKRMKPTPTELGIRKRRKRQEVVVGITRHELATRLRKKSVRTIDYWLSGKTHPSAYITMVIEGWANESEEEAKSHFEMRNEP